MPEEAVVENPSSEPSLSDYRAEREGKVTPAADPVPAEPAKSADGPEPSKQESSEVEEAGKDTEKPKGGFQRRIDKLRKEIGERDTKIAELTSRMSELEKKNPQVMADAKADGDPKPKADNFKEYDEYLEAVSRWAARQERKAADEATAKAKEAETKAEKDKQTEEVNRRKKENFDHYNEGLAVIEDRDPGASKVIMDTMFPNYIYHDIVDMGAKGAEVAYALAKDKTVLDQILKLNEDAYNGVNPRGYNEAFWIFGDFVRSLKDSPKPVERPVSKAPSPITPVRGGDAPTDADEDSMSLSEYRKRREARR